MKTLLSKIKLFIRLQKAKKKEVLPQGLQAFNTWSDDVLDLYGLPNNDSTKFALATMILHAKEDASSLSKEFFGIRLRKGAANQVAAGVMQDLKAKQQAEQKALEEAIKTVSVEQSKA